MEYYLRVIFFSTLLLGMAIVVKSDDGGSYDDDHVDNILVTNHSPALDASLLQSAVATDGSGVFDVSKYGAKGDGSTDNTKAFQETWAAACAFNGQPRLVIPGGTYLVGEITFEGPCKNSGPIAVEVTGNLVAPGSLSAFKDSSWITFYNVKGLVIKGDGTLDGKGGAEAWGATNCPKTNKCNIPPSTLKLISCSDGEISGIKLKDAKAFNVRINKCTNMKLHDLHITCPADSPNTDGIHLSDCTGVKIYHSDIGVGDDCISIGDGNTDIDVRNVNCGPGHGISIGSLGKYQGEQPVSGVYVGDCTLTGTDNGVRIKTWPGSPSSVAKNITFENIIMDKVSFPIIIDQNYCPAHHCTDQPSAVAISDVKYIGIRGTSFTKLAVNLICSASSPCKNVELSDINLSYQGTGESTASMCQNVTPSVEGTVTPSGSCSQ